MIPDGVAPRTDPGKVWVEFLLEQPGVLTNESDSKGVQAIRQGILVGRSRFPLGSDTAQPMKSAVDEKPSSSNQVRQPK